MKTLNESDFQRAATKLGCHVAAVKAVCEVEAPNGGFDASGEPRILFEGHKFSALTKGRYDKTHPTISYPKWVRTFYAKGPTSDARNAGEHQRLAEASALDRPAALMSASWGKFQIMGANYGSCGYPTLQGFINAMYAGVDGHFAAMVGFIRSDADMVRALRRHDWASFARLYNGPAFRQNKYDSKLADAYAQHQQGGKRDA